MHWPRRLTYTGREQEAGVLQFCRRGAPLGSHTRQRRLQTPLFEDRIVVELGEMPVAAVAKQGHHNLSGAKLLCHAQDTFSAPQLPWRQSALMSTASWSVTSMAPAAC